MHADALWLACEMKIALFGDRMMYRRISRGIGGFLKLGLVFVNEMENNEFSWKVEYFANHVAFGT